MRIYKPHGAALTLPPMKQSEMDALKQSIVSQGQLFAAVILDGKLLDGRNRQEAIRQLVSEKKLAPTTELLVVEWYAETKHGRKSVAEFVKGANVDRRHLNESQRAMVAARLLPMLRAEAKERQRQAARDTNTQRKSGKRPAKKAPSKSAAQIASDSSGYKVSSRTVERAEFVTKTDPALAKQVFAGELTVKQAERRIRKRGQLALAKQYKPPPGEFAVISVDYSWTYGDKREGNESQAGALPYPPMTVEEICAFPIPAAANCLLVCWVTNPILLDLKTWAVVQASIEARGFRARQIRTWVKTEADGSDFCGIGDPLRGDTEHAIYFVRGDVAYNPTGAEHGNPIQRTSFRAPVGEHSAKPDVFYEDLIKLCPMGPRLEMFARKTRPGWEGTGSELAKPTDSGDAAPAAARPATPRIEESPASPPGGPSFSQHGGSSSVLSGPTYECGTCHAEFPDLDALKKHRGTCAKFYKYKPVDWKLDKPVPAVNGELVTVVDAFAMGAMPVIDDAQHEAALAEVTRLVALDPKDGTPDGQRLKKLAAAVEAYEKQRWPMEKPAIGFTPPVEPASTTAVPDDEIPF